MGYMQDLVLGGSRSLGCIKGGAAYVVTWNHRVVVDFQTDTVAPYGHISAIRGILLHTVNSNINTNPPKSVYGHSYSVSFNLSISISIKYSIFCLVNIYIFWINQIDLLIDF